MSLEDIFNPNDGGSIDFIDNIMVKLHKKIGDVWQKKTHKSVDTLKKGLYLTSAASLAVYATKWRNYVMVLPSFNNVAVACGVGIYPKAPLESEIQSEAMGFHKKTWKYLNLILYGLGAAYTLEGGIKIGTGITTGNSEFLNDGVEYISYGIGAWLWATANYLQLSNFEPPPNKPKKKALLERLKVKIGELLPQPAPQPVPVQKYSASEPYELAQPNQ